MVWEGMEGMGKKMKRGLMRPPYYPVDEEAKNRLKLQGLMQDFAELQKETEDLKQHLQASKQRKLTLTAEVRFLRRRLKYLMKTPLQIAAPEIPVQSHNMTHLKEPMQAKKRKYKEKAPVVEKPREVIDLNKVSLPKDEDVGDFQVPWEPLKMDKKLKRCSTEEETMANKLSLPVYKDVASGSNRAGKRKITWQDQVALRV